MKKQKRSKLHQGALYVFSFFLRSGDSGIPHLHFSLEKTTQNKRKETTKKKGIKRSKLRQSALHIHWETAFIGKFENANMQALCRNLFLFCFFLPRETPESNFALEKKAEKHERNTQETKKRNFKKQIATECIAYS